MTSERRRKQKRRAAMRAYGKHLDFCEALNDVKQEIERGEVEAGGEHDDRVIFARAVSRTRKEAAESLAAFLEVEP